MRRTMGVLVLASLGCAPLSGCMPWKPGWRTAPASPLAAAPTSLEEAERMAAAAADRASLEHAIAAYRGVLAAEPENFDALTALGHLHLLLGDAYTTKGSERRTCYRLAGTYAERAMYTNPEFRGLADDGEPTWTACRALGARELDAMGFWVNAVFYGYKEQAGGGLAQAVNFRWVTRAKQVLDRMSEVDSSWADGGVDFIRAIYYLSIPESVGGDRKKSAALFQKAIDEGPTRWLHRWGRAKYYCIKMKDRETFVRDLEWIVAQDPSTARDHPAWRTYFVNDAKTMLQQVDRYF